MRQAASSGLGGGGGGFPLVQDAHFAAAGRGWDRGPVDDGGAGGPPTLADHH